MQLDLSLGHRTIYLELGSSLKIFQLHIAVPKHWNYSSKQIGGADTEDIESCIRYQYCLEITLMRLLPHSLICSLITKSILAFQLVLCVSVL
jgi:hypothetical protein